jgi:polysaccharide chain length determinant protein (PEP-CTERM system associated)
MIFELLDRVLRSWWTVVAGVCIGLAGAIVFLHYAPKQYEANTKIFVAPPKIPEEYLQSVVTDDTQLRLEALKEAVLSRPYMLRLIEETFGLPATEEEAERLMAGIRGRVQVTVMRGFFILSYRDNDAERAATVVNTLADLYTQQNVQYRTEMAKETTTTLEDLAGSAKVELETKEKAIAAFRARHLYDTGDQLQANLQLHASRQKDLESNSKALFAAQERLQILQTQQSHAASGAAITTPSVPSIDPYSARLTVLQRELESLRARYHENHPDVQAKRRELEDMLAGASGARASGDDAPNQKDQSRSSMPLSPLEVQIRSTAREIQALEAEQGKIRSDIALYQRRIEATPIVEQQLAELTKGYDVLVEQFKNYQSKAGSARGSQILEEGQKSTQFEVIERAVPPSIPVAPVPMIVYAMGLAGGLAFFVGPLLVYALINPVVHSEQGLEAVSKVPVLASIPRIETPQIVKAVRQARSINIGLSALSASILVGAVVAVSLL